MTKFTKSLQYTGWSKNVMPIASSDAGSTEWELAKLMDQDPNIEWWVRLYTPGQAFIPTMDGNYLPDFIAIDTDGVKCLIEGKSDKNANDADVLRKRAAAETWARAVRDE